MSLVFGKYEKIRRIAQGGMGEVYLARQTGVLDRLAILKSLRGDLASDKDLVEQFLDEARVAATLNHPNIVSIFDVGEWHGTYYIAMEYVSGKDLSKLWYAAAKAGVGLPFQSDSTPQQMPNMVWLYRVPILLYWAEHDETLGHVITHVLVHEIGHHFGLSDDDMYSIEKAAE